MSEAKAFGLSLEEMSGPCKNARLGGKEKCTHSDKITDALV
ncbi:hypothetical protein BSNK01_07590 [Bacillaceae bacterium]